MDGEANLTLLHVLNNQCLLPVFRVFCKSQGTEEYLNFWFDVRMHTNKFLCEPNSATEPSDCVNLFKKYFYADSVYKIQIDPKIGNELQDALKAKQPNIQLFEGNNMVIN